MAGEIRIKLERVDVVERVKSDALLASSELVRHAGVEVLRAGKAMRFGERAQLFHQGEAGESLLFILAGNVRLYAVVEGEGVELEDASAGGVVGECEIIDGPGTRVWSAIARGQVDALELTHEQLKPALPRLLPHLRELRAARLAKMKELTDFLNRW